MKNNHSRRKFINLAGRGLLAAPLAFSLAECTPATKTTATAAPSLSDIVELAKKSAEAKRVLNVRDFGATGDGQTKDTLAFQQAMDRCSILGGGEVLVPAGNYLCGAIQLRSNTLLRFEQDAVITGSPDFADYPVSQVRWEGKWMKGHTALLYAINAENICVVGPGKIVGNPALGGRPNTQYPLRHPALIEPISCKNLLFTGFSTSYHLMWSMHPTDCENLVFKNLTIRSTGGNGDGIDIDSCKNVQIDGCDIATGDDCISLKSGRGMEGYSLMHTTENVVITNCTFADSIFACIGIGSETSGGIRKVVVRNCKFTGAKTYAVYIKSRPGRGAFIEDIVVDSVEVSGAAGGFLRLNLLGSGLQDENPVPGDDGIPTAKNYQFSNIHVTDVPVLVEGTGVHPSKPLDGLVLSNITGTCSKGITLANMKNVKLSGIKVTGYAGPLLGIYNVSGSGLEGAVSIDAPKVPDAIAAPATPYQLH